MAETAPRVRELEVFGCDFILFYKVFLRLYSPTTGQCRLEAGNSRSHSSRICAITSVASVARFRQTCWTLCHKARRSDGVLGPRTEGVSAGDFASMALFPPKRVRQKAPHTQSVIEWRCYVNSNHGCRYGHRRSLQRQRAGWRREAPLPFLRRQADQRRRRGGHSGMPRTKYGIVWRVV